MPINGTSSSPSVSKHSRQQNPNSKPPKQVKAKPSHTHAPATTAAAPQLQNVGSKDTPPHGEKGRNKRTADVLALFSEKEMRLGTIRLRKDNGARKKPRIGNQGSWKERAGDLEKQDDGYFKTVQASLSNPNFPASGGKSPGPIITPLDDKDLTALSATNRPTHDELDHVICKHCKKPVIKAAAVQHIKACLRAKTEKAKERKKAKEAALAAAAAAAAALIASKGEVAEVKEEGSVETGVGAGVGVGVGARGTGAVDLPEEAADVEPGKAGVKKKGAKKMVAKKATGETKKSKKQRMLEEKLAKEAKPKKKKEKPAKPEPKPRPPVDVEKQCGVPLPTGLLCARSLTCKSHSMGAKRAVLGRSQPYDVLLGAYQRKSQAKQREAAINASGPHPDENDSALGPVDSDEETELVMAAVARACPVPMVTQTFIPVRKKYQYLRMRDMLSAALRPGMGLFGVAGSMGIAMTGAAGVAPDSALMESVSQADGDVVMGGMIIGGQPMMRGGGGSSRGGGLFSGLGSAQGRGASVPA